MTFIDAANSYDYTASVPTDKLHYHTKHVVCVCVCVCVYIYSVN